MRPIKLQVQGLTAYRQPVEVDFTDLDLFAIAGPTGAGKSSLVDAMTFALFGQMPRVGRSVKELISQGEERLRVSLEFSSNGGRYRIMRSTAKKGTNTVQMDRFDPSVNDWVPEEDRAENATQHVERLLGMDYDGFVRSVLLPQGQFQQFLSGKPEERRKVLDGLLRLDVYQRMQQRANLLQDMSTREADGFRQRLDADLADATEEALRAARQRLQELESEAKALTTDREALEAASRAAEELSRCREARRKAETALAAAEAELAKAQELLQSGQKVIEALSAQIEATEKQIAANTYDADLHNRLSSALVLVQQVDRTAARLAQMHREIAGDRSVLEKAAKAEQTQASALVEAQAAVVVAEASCQEARRHDLAAALRHELKPGDPCPVCGHKVAVLPLAEHVLLSDAEAALAAARSGETAARQAAQDAEKKAALARQKLSTLERQAVEAETDAETHRSELEALLAGQQAAPKEIAEAVRQQDAARKERERLQEESRKLSRQRDSQANAMAGAGHTVAALQIEARNQQEAIDAATKGIAAGQTTVMAAAAANGWEDVAACQPGSDPLAALKSRLSRLQAELAEVQRETGASNARIGHIEEGIERAKELREKEKLARQAASLARDLATLLRVDRFQAFVRGRALSMLAEDGSRRLQEISSGRYEFTVEGQEFLVLDRWNGSETRSVKTLSGGEAFLASLSLALALAERLPALGAGGQGRTLESLFIDEGFSYLDDETLGVVASALEVLGGSGERMVGVITHLQPLADRMPARITVNKSPVGSTLSID